jgi:ABC-type molybdenum transport system ATPase subunit/photorepair protein PhrA
MLVAEVMTLIRFNELSIGFRGPPLLDGVTCQIEPGQRIGLLARNGSGKTTLLRVISGDIPMHPYSRKKCLRRVTGRFSGPEMSANSNIARFNDRFAVW